MADNAETEKALKIVCGDVDLHDFQDYFEIVQQRKKY